MDFLQVNKTINTKTQQSVACIESYCEYVESKIRDIGEFTTDNSENESYMSVIVSNVVGEYDRIVTLAKSEFQKAMNGDDAINIILPDGTTTQVDAQKVLDSVNTQLIGAQVESQFIQYCKNTKDNISSSDFVSRIQSLVNDVAPSILEAYTKILDSAGDKLDALAAFFTLHNDSEITYSATNNYITVVDGAKYEGSVWSAAGTMILKEISGFFNVVWEGIDHIKEFVLSIVDGIKQLGKWFITKVFRNLSTVYEKLGDDPAQAMDLPLVQIDLGAITGNSFTQRSIPTLSNWITNYDYWDVRDPVSGDYEYNRYNLSCNLRCNKWEYGYQFDTQIVQSLLNKVTTINIPDDGIMSTVDEKPTTFQTMDMILPSKPFNLLMRLGVRKIDKHLFLCMYACFTKGTLDLDDDEIATKVSNSFQDAIEHVLMPLTWFARRRPVDNDHVQPFYYAIRLRAFFMDQLGGDVQTLYDCVKNKMYNIHITDVTPAEGDAISDANLVLTKSDAIMMLLQYAAFVGAGNVKYKFDFSQVPTGSVMVSKVPAIPWNNQSWAACFSVVGASITHYEYDYDLEGLGNMSNMGAEYIPYNVANPIPFSVHYQTISEQAEEIVNLFWAAVAVIAITVITVKVLRWRKNRLNTATLLQANRDRISWDYCANPTAENRRAFLKAQNKYRRYNKLNKLLGLSSASEDLYNLVLPSSDASLQQVLSSISGNGV